MKFIDSIISFSVKNPVLIGIMVFVLVIWGSISLVKLPIDAVPDVTSNQVDILTNSPSLATTEVERFITAPIEQQMANIPKLQEVRSISRFGMSVVRLVFDDDKNINEARQQVFERLASVDIPEELGKPEMGPVTTGLGEVYQYVLRPKDPTDKSFDLMEIRTIQDWNVRRKLLGIQGIAEINTFGGYKKEYQAFIKPDRMKSLGVTIDELYHALKTGNSNTGGSYIEKDNKAYVIRGIGLATSLEDIGKTVIKVRDKSPVLVKDVADISYGYPVRNGAVTMNGNGEVVAGIIMMLKGENGYDLINRLKGRISEIKAGLPEGIVMESFIDREQLISRAIKTVATNLIEGALIVVVVILVFLGNWRASLLAASVIPLSMMFAFGMMVQTGVVGTLMSLGAIDFGLLVDPAIIIVESVVMYMALKLNSYSKSHNIDYRSKQLLVIDAASEVKRSVIFGGLIILIVYFPILTLTGIEGKMFSPMAKTVAFAIAGAIFLAITYVPMMAALILKPDPNHGHSWSEKIVDKIYETIEPVVDYSIAYKRVTVAIALLILIGGGFGFSKIGGEFIPKLQEGDFNIEMNLPVGSSLTESIKLSQKVQSDLLKEFPDEINKVVCKIGTTEIPMDPAPLETQDIVVNLNPKEQWTKAHSQEELGDLIADFLNKYPGTIISVQQPIENRVNELMSGAKTDVVVKLYGNEIDTLMSLAKRITYIIKTVDGATDIQGIKAYGLPQINIRYDRNQLAFYGITVEQVNFAIQTAFAGATAGIIYEKNKRFDLTLRLSGSDRGSIENIQGLLISDSQGRPIPLYQLADITTKVGYSEIRHESMQRMMNVGFNVRGKDMSSVVNDLKVQIDKSIYIPYGYQIKYGGEFENFERATARLAVVLPISLLIILLLLYMTFNNMKDSLLIYAVVPLSAVGGVFSLLLRDMNFSISAGVGFIALFGIAVLNAIMLVSRFNALRLERNTDIVACVKEGLKEKFRPVLLTSMVAALGFIPMAISKSAGAEVQKPLATVVIGGLFTATILTLFVLPVLYIIFNSNSKTTTTQQPS
ncbi:MAG: CusA/CzcA family heavy metal efflux RND transporter [Cytophagaceae bacterium]